MQRGELRYAEVIDIETGESMAVAVELNERA